MGLEVWYNGTKTMILRPERYGHHYLEYRDGTYWIKGVTLYWLLNNGWRHIP